jgi:hypothetical protein
MRAFRACRRRETIRPWRDALRRHMVALSSEHEADAWAKQPLSESERSLSEIADWGPAEDWADWEHAAR